MNRCRRSLIVLVAGCLVSHGQPPTFHATTTLVEFTLVALDGKGQPITDLKKEEVSCQKAGTPGSGLVEKTPDGTAGISHVPGTIRLPENRKSGGKPDKVRYARRWEVHPETTEIRLIVRDRLTGRYGAIEMRVKQIPAAKAAPPNAK